jgi:hypothetical protein
MNYSTVRLTVEGSDFLYYIEGQDVTRNLEVLTLYIMKNKYQPDIVLQNVSWLVWINLTGDCILARPCNHVDHINIIYRNLSKLGQPSFALTVGLCFTSQFCIAVSTRPSLSSMIRA